MPHKRSPYCTLTAISLSRELLGEIDREVRRRGWTRAGFLRYAAARALGWSETQARVLLHPETPPPGRFAKKTRPARRLPAKQPRGAARSRAPGAAERLARGLSPIR
ncbi:MAG: type II toxin-antitoxin system HicB family antitoxin [Verrucomicrobiae bacterium]|nr:type II toxin-antitoxin system HicB family antitoxin [Verrucomicrobiae bacterium]MDW8310114.1 hypothetical protein [Verrucomicrobiales bacterium]